MYLRRLLRLVLGGLVLAAVAGCVKVEVEQTRVEQKRPVVADEGPRVD